MSHFDSQHAYRRFEAEVQTNQRFVRKPDTEKFLQVLWSSSNSRRVNVPKNTGFWRAQIGHSYAVRDAGELELEIPCPFPAERMKPLRDRAPEGRANPKGIPSLYLATTEKAAISETRPWIGSLVSVGQFLTTRELTIVDCSRSHKEAPWHHVEDWPEEKWDDAVWIDIDRAFAAPVTRADDSSDYAPTQIIADLFRANGADGLAYKSAFGDDGYNVVLFDLAAADLGACHLYYVTGVDFQYRDELNSYYRKMDTAP